MLDALWARFGVAPHWCDLRFGGDMRYTAPRPQEIADFDRRLHLYYLASCRAIWRLLPQEGSRHGVELAEQFLVGAATAEELNKYHYFVEGAAFTIDYNTEPEAIKRWVSEVRAIPEAELRSMLHPPETALQIDARELLKRAAYFADYAFIYPSIIRKLPPPPNYRPFLSADLLRRHLDRPILD